MNRYEEAKEIYASIGVDTDTALKSLKEIPISMQCWQGDDVGGFLFKHEGLSGGIQTTGNYPGRARNATQLREDIEKAMSLIPGKHRLNLHAIYAETDEKVDLNSIAPRHYKTWIDWAKKTGCKLDFNPTCFSHGMAATGLTVSSPDPNVREFWVEHCIRSRRIAELIGKELDDKCVVNYWFPDGYKDNPVDRLSPRKRMAESLDKIFAFPIDEKYVLDALESKLFGIGAESYTTGSNEFCLAYAMSRKKSVCLDAGHFHPTEVISDKISSVLLFTNELLLHVSRPVRWDSDHVVIFDDELRNIANALVSNDLLKRTHIGLDYFDASINRVAAWVIGMRNMQKALLSALLTPWDQLKKAEVEGDYTKRLALTEDMKIFPLGAVWDRFCEENNVPLRNDWLNEVKSYEASLNRDV